MMRVNGKPKETHLQAESSDAKEELIIKELEKMSSINNVNIATKGYTLNLTMDELQKRTHKDYLTTKKNVGC